jgi:hypothetical protein
MERNQKSKILPDWKTWMFFAGGDEFTFLGAGLGGKEIMLGIKGAMRKK